MNLFVATLNVGNRPLEPDQLNRWLREAKHCDVCIVCLQEAHVVTERHLERGKSVAALLAAGALAWPTWGVSCCLAIPYVCRQRRKREERHEKEKQEARALSNPSLSPQQKRARVTLGSSRRIRDCLHHLGFSVRKKPSLAWGQLRYVFHDRVDGVRVPQTHRLLVFAKRDVSVVLKRHKVARVGGLVVNRDLGTGVMGNKGGLVSTFVVEKEGFATTCTAINAHLYAAGVPWSRTRVRAARIEERRRGGGPTRHREATRRWRGGGRTKSSMESERYTTHTETRQKKTQARPRGQVPRAHGRPRGDPEEGQGIKERHCRLGGRFELAPRHGPRLGR